MLIVYIYICLYYQPVPFSWWIKLCVCMCVYKMTRKLNAFSIVKSYTLCLSVAASRRHVWLDEQVARQVSLGKYCIIVDLPLADWRFVDRGTEWVHGACTGWVLRHKYFKYSRSGAFLNVSASFTRAERPRRAAVQDRPLYGTKPFCGAMEELLLPGFVSA